MTVLRLTVPGLVALALALAMACSSSEPPEEVAEGLEGVFIEAPETPDYQAMHRGNPARTGVFETEGVLETPEAKWVFQADRAIISSAVLVDDKVIFGSDDGNLYALEAATGRTVWTFEVGRQVRTSPLVADGIVYFGDDSGHMNAINVDDGEVLWRQKIAVIQSSPVISRGTIFFGSNSGVLHAYDARTGLLSWGDAAGIEARRSDGPGSGWRHYLRCQFDRTTTLEHVVRARSLVRRRSVELSHGGVGSLPGRC